MPNAGNTQAIQQKPGIVKPQGQTGTSDRAVSVLPQRIEEKETTQDEQRDILDNKKQTTQAVTTENQKPLKSGKDKPQYVESIKVVKPTITKTDKRTEKPLIANRQQKTTEEPVNKTEIIQNDIAVKNEEEKEKISQPAIAQKDLQESNQPVIAEEIAALKKDSLSEKGIDKEKEVPVVTKNYKTGSKIKWGVDFSSGISDSRNKAFLSGLFSGGAKDMMDQYYYSPGNAGGPTGYIPPLRPSSVKPGFGFKIGPVAEINISERSNFSFGLQYAYMSSKMQVGTYTYSPVVVNNTASQSLRVDAFYRGIQRQNFTNKYHFIQMPLQYQLQLNKGKKLPILWGIGLSAGYLVATNGLAYDTTAGGIYYRDRDVFNKFHLNINTGFSFRVGNTKKIQWSVGPEVSMGMNKLMKDAYGSKQYLLYGGLTGRLIFSKKK